MININFHRIFNEIKEKYDEYMKLPVVFGNIMTGEPSLIIKNDGDKWVEKVYRMSNGHLYIVAKMYNIVYTIEMLGNDLINSFLLGVNLYDDEYAPRKFSVSAHPMYQNEYEGGKRYLSVRYKSNECSFDLDDENITEENFFTFLNHVCDGSFHTEYKSMFNIL